MPKGHIPRGIKEFCCKECLGEYVEGRKDKLNERIWRTYKRSGLKRQEYADALGVSLSTVHCWLRPKSNASYHPASEMAVRLAERLWK